MILNHLCIPFHQERITIINGAQGGIWTLNPSRALVSKTKMYTIPTPAQMVVVVGFEPTRQLLATGYRPAPLDPSGILLKWGGWRDSNSLLKVWKTCVIPIYHTRIVTGSYVLPVITLGYPLGVLLSTPKSLIGLSAGRREIINPLTFLFSGLVSVSAHTHKIYPCRCKVGTWTV